MAKYYGVDMRWHLRVALEILVRFLAFSLMAGLAVLAIFEIMAETERVGVMQIMAAGMVVYIIIYFAKFFDELW